MRYEFTDYEWAAIKPLLAEQATRRNRSEPICFSP
jgi:hypothetical protein